MNPETDSMAAKYEAMMSEALRQPGVSTIMETMSLMQKQQETTNLLVATSNCRVTAAANSNPVPFIL